MFVFFPGRMFPGGGAVDCPTGSILLLLLLLLRLGISSLRAYYELKNLLAESSIIFPMAYPRASSPTTGMMVLISGMVHWLHGLFEIEYMGRLRGY
jgi:hypothetical protein